MEKIVDYIAVTKLLADNKIHMFKGPEYPKTAACGQVMNKVEEANLPQDDDLFCDACLPYFKSWIVGGSV